ncbi:acyltransferase family protein [Chloroflexota bacterium]
MNSAPSQVAESNVATKPARLYYLDWLRVLAMFSIFFFHSDRFFDFDGWHVKNAATSLASTIHIQFFNQWMMPLFFILSGAAVYYSLRSRTGGGFIKERSLRILIPWIFIGIFVIAPPQVYLERLIHGEFSGTFFQFYYPHYFDGIYAFGGNFAIVPMHLWYLVLLFLFSLIALPLFLPSKNTGKSLTSRLATSFEKPWALLLLFVPLAAVAILADVVGLGFTRQMGSWDMLSYLMFFIYGYLIVSNTKILEVIRRYSTPALIVALVLTVLLFVLYIYLESRRPELLHVFSVWMGLLTLRGLLAWCWIIAILGFGSRYLNFNNRFLGYATEAVLPFYILHQTIILIIGFFVVQWSMGIAPKYFIIATTSFVAIMVIYDLMVRRINVLRFLFGMRLTKKLKVT